MRNKILVITTFILLFFSAQASNNSKYYTKALELYNAKKFIEAQSELTKALGQNLEPNKHYHAEYLLLMCQSESDNQTAKIKIQDFLDKNPESIYANDLRYALGRISWEDQNWANAEINLLMVNPYKLDKSYIDMYNFMLAHSYFVMGKDAQAIQKFSEVSKKSPLNSHVKYYTSYLDYTNGNYKSAQEGFSELKNDKNYSALIPFYNLHLEFLQDNHNYVTENGAALAARANSPRDREILRLIAESWYHMEQYRNALVYMNLYKEKGGAMNRQERYIIGFCNYKLGNWAEAAKELNKVAGAQDKLSQNSAYHLAYCYLQLNNKHAAMQSFSIAASSTDADEKITEDALFNYGKLQYETGGGVFNEAINILTRYIKEYPNTARTDKAREYLISAYYNSNNFQAAYEAISTLGNPDNNIKAALQKISYFRALEYFTQGDITNAERLLKEAEQNKFTQKFTALTSYWQAEILCLKGEFAQAISLFKSYIRVAPRTDKERLTALYSLGSCYFNLKNWDESAKYFKQFTHEYKINDSFKADAYNRLGDVSLAKKSYWDAIANYDKTLKLNTREKYYAAYQRAMVLGMVNRNSRKIESLEAIISENKGDYTEDASFELGKSYTTDSQYNKAATAYQNYLKKYAESSRALQATTELGLIYQNLKDDNKALEYYSSVVKKSPHSVEGKTSIERMKSIYVNTNKIDEFYNFIASVGIQTDKLLIERDSLIYMAAEKIYLSGNTTEAGRVMEEYLDNNPHGAYRTSALYYGADCAIKTSDNTKAEKLLEELRAMHYNDFSISTLEKLGDIYTMTYQYDKATDTYGELANLLTDTKKINQALLNEIKSSLLTEDTLKVINSTEHALTNNSTDDNTLRIARFNKAKMLNLTNEAYELFALVSSEPHTEQGAESTYILIEKAYKDSELDKAEEMVMAFADKNTPHTYWVGKAFIILGDVYLAREDSFQARATYQSIVDGYMPQNDGVVSEAKHRIENLK